MLSAPADHLLSLLGQGLPVFPPVGAGGPRAPSLGSFLCTPIRVSSSFVASNSTVGFTSPSPQSPARLSPGLQTYIQWPAQYPLQSAVSSSGSDGPDSALVFTLSPQPPPPLAFPPFRKWELSFQLPLGQKPRLPLACSPLSYLCSVLPPTLLALLSDHTCSLTTSHGLHCSQPLPSLRAFLQGTGSCCPRCSCSHYTPRSSQSDPFKTEAVSRPVSARKSANSLKVKPMSI